MKPSIDWIAASDLEDESARLVHSLYFILFFVSACFDMKCLVIYSFKYFQTPEAHAAAWKTLKVKFCSCLVL